jgi:hypothetical protein
VNACPTTNPAGAVLLIKCSSGESASGSGNLVASPPVNAAISSIPSSGGKIDSIGGSRAQSSATSSPGASSATDELPRRENGHTIGRS